MATMSRSANFQTLFCFAVVATILLNRVAAGKPADKTPPGQQKKTSEEQPAKTPPGQQGKDDPCASSGDSTSTTQVSGWYTIHTVGTGKECLTKEKDKTKTVSDECGDWATTEATIEFYGVSECEEGDKGNAKVKIRAEVLAEAQAIGPECVALVIAEAEEEASAQHKVHDDVTVTASALAEGDASALCIVQ